MFEDLDKHKALSERIDEEIARQDERRKRLEKWSTARFAVSGLVHLGVLVFLIWAAIKIMLHFQII